MYYHTDFLLARAAELRRERVAEVEQHRLLNAARRARRRGRPAGRAAGTRGGGSLAGCAPPAAA